MGLVFSLDFSNSLFSIHFDTFFFLSGQILLELVALLFCLIQVLNYQTIIDLSKFATPRYWVLLRRNTVQVVISMPFLSSMIGSFLNWTKEVWGFEIHDVYFSIRQPSDGSRSAPLSIYLSQHRIWGQYLGWTLSRIHNNRILCIVQIYSSIKGVLTIIHSSNYIYRSPTTWSIYFTYMQNLLYFILIAIYTICVQLE